MSDFASLLQQLDQTAKRVAAAPASKSEEEEDRRKRPRPRDHDEVIPSIPRDFRQLKIRLAFLCIGAQKAGTTWLHEMLLKIPGLSLPCQKELHFFDWHRHKGLGWYSRQFPSSEGSLCGEITPCYMALPDHAIREIKQLFPSVRIIFVARDLVERAWSALTMELRNAAQGRKAGEFGTETNADPVLLNRMEQEADPNNQQDSYFMNRLEHSTHSERSDYASGVRRWLKHFPKEQLLILDYRQIADNPNELIKQILKHIQLRDGESGVTGLSNDELSKKFNVSIGPSSIKEIRPGLRKKMEKHLRSYAKDFNALLRELDYTWRLDEYA